MTSPGPTSMVRSSRAAWRPKRLVRPSVLMALWVTAGSLPEAAIPEIPARAAPCASESQLNWGFAHLSTPPQEWGTHVSCPRRTFGPCAWLEGGERLHYIVVTTTVPPEAKKGGEPRCQWT